MERHLEHLIYELEYDEIYELLEFEGWSDEDIDALCGVYRN